MTSRWPHDTPSFSSRNRSQFSVSESYRLMGQNNFEPTQSQYNIVYDKKYVEDLRKSFLEQQTEKRVIRNNEKLGTEARHIQRRLKEHGHPVELGTLTCLSGHCGRSFERIQVLAFHVSYAHQDLMTSHSSHLTCLLCGKKWTTVRRKIMHLSLAHRNIGEEHNAQCMQQVESVIAPNAPKARRLERARRVYDDDYQELYDGPDPYLEEEEEEGEDDEGEEGEGEGDEEEEAEEEHGELKFVPEFDYAE